MSHSKGIRVIEIEIVVPGVNFVLLEVNKRSTVSIVIYTILHRWITRESCLKQIQRLKIALPQHKTRMPINLLQFQKLGTGKTLSVLKRT